MLAGPPSVGYRLNKFVRRHKAFVAGTVAVLAVSLIGTVVSIILAVGQARTLAEAQAVSAFLENDVLGACDTYKLGSSEPTIRSVLDAASKSLAGRFADKPLVEASIRHVLAGAYWGLGLHEQAEIHMKRALRIRQIQLGPDHPDTLSTICNLGWVYSAQSRYAEAEEQFTRALQGARLVLKDGHGTTIYSMHGLADVYNMQGRFEEAERAFRRVLDAGKQIWDANHPEILETKNGLGVLHARQKRYDEAEKLFLEAFEGRRLKLGDAHPHTLESINNLIDLYEAWNKPEEAGEWRAELSQMEDFEE